MAKEVNRKVYSIDVPFGINPEAQAIVEELGASMEVEFCRMFNKGCLVIQREKMFGLASVELG